jgi:hypothetical protein
LVPLFVALSATLVGAAPVGNDLPAVTVSPIDHVGPNGGQWFSVAATPGATIDVAVQLTNSADAAQSVTLYLADLTVGDDDRPAVGDRGVGVGAWGAFDTPTRTVAAHGVAPATFRLSVPANAEPGDHLGAVVAESAPTTNAAGVNVVKRVAARLYVTVPGDAKPGVAIAGVRVRNDSALLPRHVSVAIVVRNTGNVRLRPSVTVNGHRVSGPPLVVSRSSERYDARVPLSIWGGRKSLRVEVATRTEAGTGPAAGTTRKITIVPWWTALGLFLCVVGFFTVRELRRRLR